MEDVIAVDHNAVVADHEVQGAVTGVMDKMAVEAREESVDHEVSAVKMAVTVEMGAMETTEGTVTFVTC